MIQTANYPKTEAKELVDIRTIFVDKNLSKEERIAAFTEEITRFEAHGMLDQYDSLLTYSRIARHDLQLLLRYFEWADELKAMCARARSAA